MVVKPSWGGAGYTNQSQQARPAPEGGGRLVGVFLHEGQLKSLVRNEKLVGTHVHPQVTQA